MKWNLRTIVTFIAIALFATNVMACIKPGAICTCGDGAACEYNTAKLVSLMGTLSVSPTERL